MSFAKNKYVTEMRDLLLQHGATESDQDREWLDLRQHADEAEKTITNNYKNIDKYYNPWSGNEMDFWEPECHGVRVDTTFSATVQFPE